MGLEKLSIPTTTIAPAIKVVPQAAGDSATDTELSATCPGEYRVIRRNGKLTAFSRDKIKVAMTKAFLAVEGGNAAASSRIHETVETLTEQVSHAITRRLPGGGTVHIEDIQDQVELALMRGGAHKVARAYVLYREERARARAAEKAAAEALKQQPGLHMTLPSGEQVPLDETRLERIVGEACEGMPSTEPLTVLQEAKRNLFDGVAEKDVYKTVVMAARTFIENEPDYTYVAARLLTDSLRHEALSFVYSRPMAATTSSAPWK